MTDHTDHRKRMKERFLAEGLDHFNDINALELLLFYCVPQKDTNPIAHELIDHFGSLAAVIDAKPEELENVFGVGKGVTTFLSLIKQLERYCQIQRSEAGAFLSSLDQCGEYLLPKFHGLSNETVMLLCLDAKSKVLCCRKVGEGSVNSAGIPVRKIVEIALNANASSVVLAHNHPSGLAVPSVEDIQTTHKVAQALSMVDVVLADHFVVADDEFVSMVLSRYYRPEV